MLDTLKRFFGREAPIARGERVLVAFSGGPDSVALLWGLRELARELGISVAAAHLDHALDPGSAERAIRARGLAAAIGVPFHCQRLPISEPSLGTRGSEGKRDQGLEAEARRQRYRYLEQQRQAFGARYIATAHHGDDQAETLLLRMLFGTGIEGLAGIRAVRGNVVRPLLSLTSAQLQEIAARQRLEPTDDPTNSDLERPRNWIRHALLPKMTLEQPDLVERLYDRRGDIAQMRGNAAQNASAPRIHHRHVR